jgi:ribonuclease VapC
MTSPLAIYEATLGFARTIAIDVTLASEGIRDFVNLTKMQIVPVDEGTVEAALTAFKRFGKGRHKAALNMGDCFAYACALQHRVPLLFKGDDFIHTDIKPA